MAGYRVAVCRVRCRLLSGVQWRGLAKVLCRVLCRLLTTAAAMSGEGAVLWVLRWRSLAKMFCQTSPFSRLGSVG